MKASERKSLFDRNWYFYRGDVRMQNHLFTTILPGEKWIFPMTGASSHSENQEPDKVVGPFSRESVGGFATGQTVGGKGWYRKTFIISPEDAGKKT